MTKDEAISKALGELQVGFIGNAMQILREALAEQPAQQLVDCHVTGVCVQSGLRAERPAQQEPAGWLQEIARLHDRIKDLEKDVEFLSLPAQQEPVGPEPFGYFQYDIRLDAWVQNRINSKGVAFYIKEKA